MEEEVIGLTLGVMVMSIPIIWIVLRSQLGKALAKYVEKKALSSDSSIDNLVQTENLLMSIHEQLLVVEGELKDLKESHVNLKKSLKSKDEQRLLP